jgi:DNA-binding response OmpR family regulator
MGNMIYIADDDKDIRELLKMFLKSDGYDVMAFSDGEELMQAFEKQPSDLVILDIMMPKKDGLECCAELRQRTNVPIIMLTAKDSELDYVQGITIGSDDYLTKPFRPTILLMKIKALLRRMNMDRTSEANGGNLSFGDLSFDSEKNIMYCRKRQMSLTRLEQQVLVYMMTIPDKAFSRDELLENIWGYTNAVESRVVDEMLRRVRKKLSIAESSVTIGTVWGYGYQLKLEGAE